MNRFISASEEETKKIAADFAKNLKPGDVVCLLGDLGAGKTAFTKGIAQALGSKYEPVSPTFNIVNEYPGETAIYHFDLYRLRSVDDLYSVDIDSYLYSDGVCVIEWPQIALPILDRYYKVEITYNGEKRNIEIDCVGVKFGNENSCD